VPKALAGWWKTYFSQPGIGESHAGRAHQTKPSKHDQVLEKTALNARIGVYEMVLI
jgi:hypothetical protein